MSRTPLWKQASLAAATLMICLIAAECGLRTWAPVAHRQPPEELGPNAWRALLHRASSVPGLAYELTPSRAKNAQGTTVRTNAEGMRDDELALPTGSRLRIAVLGDSYSFGFGVDADDVYANVLEELLNSECDEPRFEVLNFGVGGYSTRDEALVLRHKVLAYQPVALILGYVLNDPEMLPVSPLQSYFHPAEWWQHSHLLRLAAETQLDLEIQRYGDGDRFEYLHAVGRPPWQGVLAAFDDIAQLCRQHGIPAVVAIFPWNEGAPWTEYRYPTLHERIALAARERGLDVVDLLESFDDQPPKRLMVQPGDSHPSPAGHRAAASALLAWSRDKLPVCNAVGRPE